MWFKMSNDLFSCAAVRAIGGVAYRHDNGQDLRKFYFTRLLADAADGRDDLQDAADLARLLGATLKQTQIVWDVCIKFGVLRKGPKGYSAIDWMKENNLIGSGKPDTGQPTPPPRPAPQSNPHMSPFNFGGFGNG